MAAICSMPQAALPHGVSAPPHAGEFDMLQQAYLEHAGAARDPCFETSKARLSHLSDQLQAKGVYGSNALQLLQKYSSQINWQAMSPDVFSSFYRFVYFICREPNKRNVQVGTAVAAWRLVLWGRFRLLDRWCSYVGTHHKANVVLEDTWRQVLDFSRTVHEDLSNYDPASAWPVLLDEFVEYIKGSRHPNRPQVSITMEPLDMLCPWAVRPMTAVSPRSGSKRRPPDILEVADQLQQLPLMSADSGSAAAGGGGSAAAGTTAAAGPGGGAAASPGGQRTLLAAKRLRLGQAPAGSGNRPGGVLSSSMGDAPGSQGAGEVNGPAAMQGDMGSLTQVQGHEGAGRRSGGVGGFGNSAAGRAGRSAIMSLYSTGGWPPSRVANAGMAAVGAQAAGDMAAAAAAAGGDTGAAMRRRVVGGAGGASSAFGQLDGSHGHPQHQIQHQQQHQQQQVEGASSGFSQSVMGPPAPCHGHHMHASGAGSHHQRLGGAAGASMHGQACLGLTLPAPAGLGLRESGLTATAGAAAAAPLFGPPQQQQQVGVAGLGSVASVAGARSSSSMDVSMDGAEQQQPQQQQHVGLQQQLPHLSMGLHLHHTQQQQPAGAFLAGMLHPGHSAAQPPPCPSPGSARIDAESLRKTNSVIAMTVTEALGFN